MHLLSVHPACPLSLEESLEHATCLSDVLDVVRPLAYHQECFVSLQRQQTTGLQVAVKTYVKSKLSSLAKEQVLNETYIHAGLVHEYVVPLLASVEDERHIHLLVEWADGGDLREHLVGLNESRLKDFIVHPLLQALATLDAQGVVHRDLKPDNILVHQGRVRLGDFGLAVYTQQGVHQADSGVDCAPVSADSTSVCSTLTDMCLSHASSTPASTTSSCVGLDSLQERLSHRSSCASDAPSHFSSLPKLRISRPSSSAQLMGGAGGTPMYSAPEVLLAMFQSQPVSEVVTHKNDVWALGIMVLEALIGCHPYSPRSTCVTGSMFSCNLLYAVAHHPGFRFPSHLSPEATDFLRLALQVDPSKRPSAVELLAHSWLQPSLSAHHLTMAEQHVACNITSYSSRSKPELSSEGLQSPCGSGTCKAAVAGAGTGRSSVGSLGGARAFWESTECLEL